MGAVGEVCNNAGCITDTVFVLHLVVLLVVAVVVGGLSDLLCYPYDLLEGLPIRFVAVPVPDSGVRAEDALNFPLVEMLCNSLNKTLWQNVFLAASCKLDL